MPNDSSTGGYLVPSSTGPDYDKALHADFQQVIVGITGLPTNSVRRRWQPNPPAQPGFETNWVAFSVTLISSDFDTYSKHDPTAAANGAERIYRDEMLELYASFYGPDNQSYLATFRDGLNIAQNRWVLKSLGIGLRDLGQPQYVPALFKETNVLRTDIKMKFTRRIERVYPIREVSGVDLGIVTDIPPTSTTVIINP